MVLDHDSNPNYTTFQQLMELGQQLTINPGQSVIFETRFQYPTISMSTDGMSHLTLANYPFIQPQEIERVTAQVNALLKQLHESLEIYDRWCLVIFVVSMVLIFPTVGLSVFLMILLVVLPYFKQQSLTRKLEDHVKPAIRQLLNGENQRLMNYRTEWIVSYEPFFQMINGNVSVLKVTTVMLKLITTMQPAVIFGDLYLAEYQQHSGSVLIPNARKEILSSLKTNLAVEVKDFRNGMVDNNSFHDIK